MVAGTRDYRDGSAGATAWPYQPGATVSGMTGRVKDMDRWLGDYRRFFTESLDRLDIYVKELKRKEGRHAGKRK